MLQGLHVKFQSLCKYNFVLSILCVVLYMIKVFFAVLFFPHS